MAPLTVTPGVDTAGSLRFKMGQEASAELARRMEQPQRATAPKMTELLRSSRGRVKRG